MNFHLQDKIVIITGASSGIGKALAFELAKQQCKIVLVGRDAKKLQEVENILKEKNEVISLIADVSVENDCKKIIEETIKKFGAIDILINNAGISMRALLEDVDLKVLKSLMDTNFWGTVFCTKYSLPYLLKNKGSLVGISSIAGKKGLPGRTGYSASKFAMEGFLETIRIENLKKGLHVLVACPGFTTSNIRNTALNKEGNQQGESPRDEKKMMPAEKVAEKIVDAIVKRKRDLVLTSQGKLTIWLNKFFPTWMDKMVFNEMAKEKDFNLK